MKTKCDFKKACHILWAVKTMHWSQTQTAIVLNLNVGVVNHVVHGRRFYRAYPVPLPEYA